mgnify:CR=1 FL=1
MNMFGMMREFIVVLVTSLIVGIGSSYVVNTVHLAKLEERSIYVDKQIELLQDVVETIRVVQIELSRRGEWMNWVTRELSHEGRPSVEVELLMLNKRVERLEGGE